ncbi:MAG: hypothetical protein ABII00_18340 [Elusimicrobiota bacterium]
MRSAGWLNRRANRISQAAVKRLDEHIGIDPKDHESAMKGAKRWALYGGLAGGAILGPIGFGGGGGLTPTGILLGGAGLAGGIVAGGWLGCYAGAIGYVDFKGKVQGIVNDIKSTTGIHVDLGPNAKE